MRTALRRLARDDRVLGIAAAIAIGYTLATFLRSAVGILLDLAAGEEVGRGPYTVEIAGHGIAYEALARHGVTLAVIVLAAALALRNADGDAE